LLKNEFFSLSEYTEIDVGWGFAQTQLGELTALPQTPILVSRGKRQEGMEGRTRERGREGERGTLHCRWAEE